LAAERTDYLSLTDVLGLHAAIMRRMGSAPAPLRDEGLLESAVLRPQMAAYYDDADLIRQAALLSAGISQAQAFLDGNKRTAYAALEVFLFRNGIVIVVEPLEVAAQVEAIAMRQMTLDEATTQFEQWLRDRTRPR
jgi:death on curing protein